MAYIWDRTKMHPYTSLQFPEIFLFPLPKLFLPTYYLVLSSENPPVLYPPTYKEYQHPLQYLPLPPLLPGSLTPDVDKGLHQIDVINSIIVAFTRNIYCIICFWNHTGYFPWPYPIQCHFVWFRCGKNEYGIPNLKSLHNSVTIISQFFLTLTLFHPLNR